MPRSTSFNAKCIMQLEAIQNVGGVATLPLARIIAIRSIELAPKRSGFLASKIKARKISQLGAVLEAGAPYSGFVEFGTRKMAAQPFLRPAIDEKAHEMLQEEKKIYDAEIARRIRR